jgi:hypothetical protein
MLCCVAFRLDEGGPHGAGPMGLEKLSPQGDRHEIQGQIMFNCINFEFIDGIQLGRFHAAISKFWPEPNSRPKCC